MQIIAFPRLDRDRVAKMVDGPKCNLLTAMKRDPAYVSHLILTFFNNLERSAESSFGEKPALFLAVCTFRHHTRNRAESHAPLHTDANFFKPGGVGLTFWCPLDEVGPETPGVTFLSDDGEVTPQLGPGQALVVPPDLPHRTQAIAGERLSIEFRCTPCSKIPGNVAESRIALRDGKNIVVAPAPELAARGLCTILPWVTASNGYHSTT